MGLSNNIEKISKLKVFPIHLPTNEIAKHVKSGPMTLFEVLLILTSSQSKLIWSLVLRLEWNRLSKRNENAVYMWRDLFRSIHHSHAGINATCFTKVEFISLFSKVVLTLLIKQRLDKNKFWVVLALAYWHSSSGSTLPFSSALTIMSLHIYVKKEHAYNRCSGQWLFWKATV